MTTTLGALRKDGAALCWNAHRVVNQVKDVSAAADLSTPCAVLKDGTVRCWKEGATTEVRGLHGIRALSRGKGGTCAIASGGAVFCWGHAGTDSFDSPLGQTETVRQIRAMRGADEVGVSVMRGPCVRSGRHVFCWGGEFGEPFPEVHGIGDAVEISVADYHACAKRKDETVVLGRERARSAWRGPERV